MSKNKLKAFSATVLFHATLLLIFLFLFSFKTPLPLPEEIGVEISTGGGGGGSDGSFSPVESNPSDASSDDQYATQSNETAPHMNSSNPNPNNTNTEPAIDQRIVDYWNKNRNGTGGQGTGTGPGTGTGTGPGSGSGTGGGDGPGIGPNSGPSVNLANRTAKKIPVPEYTEDDQGKVVVTIWVDKNGKVVKAIPGARGTTTSNPYLWKKSKDAALQSEFSVAPDAPEEQRGTITYNYIKLN